MIIPLIVVLAIADDVHIMQHWDEERRHGDAEDAFKATVVAPGRAALRRQRHDRARHAVARDEQRRRGPDVRHRIGGRRHGRLRRSRSCSCRRCSVWMQPETARPPHERYLVGPLRRVARFSMRAPGARPRRRRSSSAWWRRSGCCGCASTRTTSTSSAQSHPLSQSAAVIDSELSGVYSFQILLEGPPDSLKTPDALQRMDRLRRRAAEAPVRQEGHVGRRLREARQQGAERRPAGGGRRAGDRGDAIAQELFVFALGGEGRHELERVVASDFSRAQISVKLASMSSDLVLEQVEEAERLAKAGVRRHAASRRLTTGSGRLFSTLDHYLVDVADQQLRDRLRHRLRRHLRRLPIGPVRPAGDRRRTCCRCSRCSA